MPHSHLPPLHSSLQERASTKATVWGRGGGIDFSSFITARCQAGSQLNFSCAIAQAFAFSRNFSSPELPAPTGRSRAGCWTLTHHLRLNAPSLPCPLLQGPPLLGEGFQLPNPSHPCEKLVLASILYSNRVYFVSKSSLNAAIFNGRLAAASTKALPTAALRCF